MYEQCQENVWAIIHAFILEGLLLENPFIGRMSKHSLDDNSAHYLLQVCHAYEKQWRPLPIPFQIKLFGDVNNLRWTQLSWNIQFDLRMFEEEEEEDHTVLISLKNHKIFSQTCDDFLCLTGYKHRRWWLVQGSKWPAVWLCTCNIYQTRTTWVSVFFCDGSVRIF